MLRKIIIASAAAVALCSAAVAASTQASAAPGFRGYVAPMLVFHGGQHAGAGGLAARPKSGGPTRCWSAECGGGTVPLDDKFVMRQCNILKGPLPPWCQGLPGAPRGVVRPIRY